MRSGCIKSMRWFRWLLFSVVVFVLGGMLFGQDNQSPGSYVGVRVLDINADRASALKLGETRGIEVRIVQPDSPAEKAGIRPGDVLLTYNSEALLSGMQLGRLVNETPPGHKVKVQYWREGKERTAVITPQQLETPKPDAASPVLDARALAVPDFPRVLMLWDNAALGIECEPIDLQLAQFFGVQSGILIRHVAKGMIGDRAGLKAGDVITGIDTRVVAVPKDLISYFRTRDQQSHAMVIQIVRDHKPRTFSITLSE
jgi:serine protease Do